MSEKSKLRPARSEAAPAVRFLGVARTWDRVLIAALRYDANSRSLAEQQALALKVLGSRGTQGHPRLTVTDRDHGSLHYDCDREYFYIVITVPDYPQRLAFKCLKELRERFAANFGGEAQKVASDGLSKQARPLLVEVCEMYEDPLSIDRILNVTKEVDEVRGILHGTINDVLSNADSLEVLEDKCVLLGLGTLRA